MGVHDGSETVFTINQNQCSWSARICIKDDGIRLIEEHGKFQISGDKEIMEPMDALLQSFVEQFRMKLPGSEYIPCYEIVD